MAYNHHLANRICERLQDLPNMEEKEMMEGLVLLNDPDWRSVLVQLSHTHLVDLYDWGRLGIGWLPRCQYKSKIFKSFTQLLKRVAK